MRSREGVQHLENARVGITRMDTVSRGGDCGLTFQTGAQGLRSHRLFNVCLHVLFVYPAVLDCLHAGSISDEDVVGTLIAVSEVVSEKIHSTNSALYL